MSRFVKATLPKLDDGFRETTGRSTRVDGPAGFATSAVKDAESSEDEKRSRRRLFGFGRKKGDVKGKQKEAPTTPKSALKTTQLPVTPFATRSAERAHGTSPYLASPAGSQIFERDVQDSASIFGAQVAPVPSHLKIDDHIPSVLDASSEAITNTKLNPDSVEIVTTSSHLRAIHTLAAITSQESLANSWSDMMSRSTTETTSSYAALDNTDIRRLSFISFADVVQSEHAQTDHAVMQLDSIGRGMTSVASGQSSSSPVASPVSSQEYDSPLSSTFASDKGADFSPARRSVASPVHSIHISTLGGGDLSVQTMAQAVRKSQSGDLSSMLKLSSAPDSRHGEML